MVVPDDPSRAPAVPQEFTDLLAQGRPEAIAIMGHWALLLHYSRGLWHVADSGAHLLESITCHLGPNWEHWLSWPLAVMGADLGSRHPYSRHGGGG
jgi:hypothetical protein